MWITGREQSCVVDALSPSPVSVAEPKCWQRITVFQRRFWMSHNTVLHPYNLHLDAAGISYGSKSKLSFQFQSKFLFSVMFIFHPVQCHYTVRELSRAVFSHCPVCPEVWLRQGHSSFWKITINYSLTFKEQFWLDNYLRGSENGPSYQKWCSYPDIFIPAVQKQGNSTFLHKYNGSWLFFCNIYDHIIFVMSLGL